MTDSKTQRRRLRLSDRAKSWLSVLSLATLPFLVFWDLVTFQKIPVAGDLLEYNYPIQYLLTQQIRAGILPLWDNRLSSGIPLVGLSQAGTFYPLNYVFALMPTWMAMTYMLLVQYSLAGVFTYAYMRRLGIGRRGAFISGLVFMFSGFLIGHLGHIAMVRTAVWLPAILWAIESWRQRLETRFIVLGAGAVAITILATHPQMIAYACGVAVLYIAWFTLVAERGYPRIKFAVGAGAILGFGALLALPQIWMMLVSFTALARPDTGYEYFTSFSLHPLLLAQLVLAGILRNNPLTPEIIGYTGVLTLALATAATFGWRHKAKLFFVLLAVFASVLVLGGFTPLYRLMYHVPGYNSFRVPPRNWLEFDFAIAVLAGAGFHTVLEMSTRNHRLAARRLVILSAALVALGLIIIGFLAFILPRPPSILAYLTQSIRTVIGPITLATPAIQTSLVILFLSALAVLLVGYRSRHWYTVAVVAGLILGDQYVSYADHLFTIHSTRQSPAQVFDYVPESVKFLKRDPSMYRVLSYSPHYKYNMLESRNLLYSDLNILYDLDSANNYDAMFLEQYFRFTDYSITNFGSVIGPNILFPNLNPSVDLLNVKYIIAPVNNDLPQLSSKVVDGVNFEFTRYPWLGLGPGALIQASFTVPKPETKPATTLAIVSALRSGKKFSDGQPVARVTVTETNGQQHVYTLLAGRDTAEWTYHCPGTVVQHSEPQVAYSYPAPDVGGPGCLGQLYMARFKLADTPLTVRQIAIEYLAAKGNLDVDKLTLYNAATQTSYPISVQQGFLGYLQNSDVYHLVYQDAYVYIFQNDRVLPRAFLAPEARGVDDAAEADDILRKGQFPDGQPFDAAAVALVETPDAMSLPTATNSEAARDGYEAKILSMRPGQVEVMTTAAAPAFLIYSENYFPGWQATMDGVRAPVYRTDGALMGLVVPAGTHQVTLTFVPTLLYYGLAGSAATLTTLLLLILMQRRDASGCQIWAAMWHNCFRKPALELQKRRSKWRAFLS